MGIGTIKIVAGTLIAALALSAAIARAENVPPDFRVYKNYANLAVLAQYDDADDRIQTNASQPRGDVKFSDGNDIPAGYRLWFLDQGEKPYNWGPSEPFYPDEQVIGVVDVFVDGKYDFEDYYPVERYMYGDYYGEPHEDEGAQVGTPPDPNYNGEEITVIVQSPDNRFYRAEFVVGAPLREFGYFKLRGGDKKNDIIVYDYNELPNLNSDWHKLEKFVYWWLANDCLEPNLWADDPNLYGCECLDVDWNGKIDFVDFADFASHWNPNDSNGAEMTGYGQDMNDALYGTSGVGAGEVGGYVGATRFRVYGPDGDEDLGTGYAPVEFGLPPRREGELVEAGALD